MNIPNILTFLRLVMIPFFIYFLLQDDPKSRLIAFLLFVIAGLSDFLDGYLARKLEQDTKLGRFLDPLADKFLVITTLFAFYYLDNQISLWIVFVIIGRDILITLMRYMAIAKGKELRTTRLAKTKTAFQMIAIILILLVFIVRSYRVDIQDTFERGHLSGKKNIEIATELLREGVRMLPSKEIKQSEKRKVFAESIPYFLMLITAFVTLISGVRYVMYNIDILKPPYHLFRNRERDP